MRFRTFLLALASAAVVLAQPYSPSLYSGMRWRQVGPFRAGRISAVAGIPGDPATYYLGTPGGGIWKSTSGGTAWKPIFDETHQESIGSIAIARSNPNIVYVGTGDVSSVEKSVNIGNGVWKSVDAGAHWQHMGLDDTNHVVSLVVDPRNPDIVLAAALGHTYARNEERGVFRSTDGGRTWTKVLYKGDTLGAVNMVADPDNPLTIFAALEVYLTTPNGRGGGGGGGRGEGEPAQPGAGIYKSTDQGLTWTYLSGHGLPESNMGRIGLAVAAGTAGQRVFAVMTGGMYRSDDGGANWHRSTNDARSSGSSYFSQVYVAPDNPDMVYVVQTSLYRSTDGGQTFTAFKGAPGGDDYHVLWIDPTNPKRILAGVDQGPTISQDGGYTWDLNWYNLPNGQFYHISTDMRFPYWIYGTQQDSGSAGTASRGAFGQITFMEWLPSVGAYEFGYVNADPLDPAILMASGQGSNIQRSNLATRQILNVSPPRSGGYRFAQYPPHCFALADPHVYYFGAQYLLETRDLGDTWKAVSPDVTLAPGETPPPAEPAAEPAAGGRGGRGPVAGISAIGPSPLRAGAVWVGTSNGHVQRTADGAGWQNVTPSDLPANSQIQQIQASPHSIDTAYFTVDRHNYNDFAPYIFRTRDGGKTWTRIVTGIPDTEIARVVKEDPVRPGLLYAGTEHGAWVSFDSGDRWQSLQLNLPTASVRDMVVHGDDLVIGTYGRAFWILDDVTPLRQIGAEIASADAYLFKPAATTRVRNDTDFDTPFPPEMTAGDESARRRDSVLQLEVGAVGASYYRYLRFRGSVSPRTDQRAASARAGAATERPELLDCQPPSALHRCRHESRGVGPAVYVAGADRPLRHPGLPHVGALWRDPSGAARPAGGAGELRSSAHGEWPDLPAASPGHHGPAGEDACRGYRRAARLRREDSGRDGRRIPGESAGGRCAGSAGDGGSGRCGHGTGNQGDCVWRCSGGPWRTRRRRVRRRTRRRRCDRQFHYHPYAVRISDDQRGAGRRTAHYRHARELSGFLQVAHGCSGEMGGAEEDRSGGPERHSGRP